MLLVSLVDSWNALMVSLGNSAIEGKVMLAMVKNSLFNKEIQMKDFVGNGTHALVMENRGRSKNNRWVAMPTFEKRMRNWMDKPIFR